MTVTIPSPKFERGQYVSYVKDKVHYYCVTYIWYDFIEQKYFYRIGNMPNIGHGHTFVKEDLLSEYTGKHWNESI